MKRGEFIKTAAAAGTLGFMGQFGVKPLSNKALSYLSSVLKSTNQRVLNLLHRNNNDISQNELGIDQIVYGEGRQEIPKDANEKLVVEISNRLGAPAKNIHAILLQERPSGQKTDFFAGPEFGKDSGKPAILLERHIYWRSIEAEGERIGISNLSSLLMQKAKEGHEQKLMLSENIFNGKKHEYGNQSHQYARLRSLFRWGKKYAAELSSQTGKDVAVIQTAVENASLMACSWGAGQVLGADYRECGYDSVRDLVRNASTVSGMIENFSRSVRGKNGFLKEIQKYSPDWSHLAKLQNGKNVASTNPLYIGNIEKYAADYLGGQDSTKTGALGDSINSTIAGVAIALVSNLERNLSSSKGQKSTTHFKKTSRRNLLKGVGLGISGGLLGNLIKKTGAETEGIIKKLIDKKNGNKDK